MRHLQHDHMIWEIKNKGHMILYIKHDNKVLRQKLTWSTYIWYYNSRTFYSNTNTIHFYKGTLLYCPLRHSPYISCSKHKNNEPLHWKLWTIMWQPKQVIHMILDMYVTWRFTISDNFWQEEIIANEMRNKDSTILTRLEI